MKKAKGGCFTSALVFLLVLALCVCVLYKLADIASGGEAAAILDMALDRLGISEGRRGRNTSEKPVGEEITDLQTGIFDDLPEANVMKLEITQEKLKALVQARLDASAPVQITNLEIYADGEVFAEVLLERDAFLEYAQSSDSPIEGIQVLLLRLAPAQIEASARAKLSYNASEGMIDIAPQELHVQKLKLPVSLLSGLLTDVFTVAVGDYAAQYGVSLGAVEFYEGYMVLYLE